jgi:hypothetical protein
MSNGDGWWNGLIYFLSLKVLIVSGQGSCVVALEWTRSRWEMSGRAQMGMAGMGGAQLRPRQQSGWKTGLRARNT